jgi:subtilisin family serine protease
LVAAIQVNGFAEANAAPPCDVVQAAAPSWGLARLSHVGDLSRGLEMNMRHNSKDHDGAGVDIYIIDTGIMITHDDFGGRARWGRAFADGGSEDDRNGHGTHCAGTAAGTRYGVAKAAGLVAVKVLSASGGGTWADVVAGVDYLATNGVSGKAVGSMSLGGSGSNAALTSAINNCVVTQGIPVVVAAGNSAADACRYTPAGIPSVISVGATEIAGFEPDEFDNRASFSNWGTCVHIFAPGRDITSSWIGSNSATNMISGTSMACPHVAGYAATLLSSQDGMSPQELKDLIQQTSQQDIIANPGTGSPNYLI